MGDRCETCDAFQQQGPDHGVCRAHAPLAALAGLKQEKPGVIGGPRTAMPIVVTMFPEISKNGWCREYGPVAVKKDQAA